MLNTKIKKIVKGSDRSTKYKKNIVFLIVSQTLGVFVSLMLVPITLNYLGTKEYGVWITLTTLIAWFSFFDIGLGHGLRNKYAEAKAQNDETNVRKYVSTAFYLLVLLSFLIFLIVLVASRFINWAMILNAPQALAPQLNILAIIVAGTFCIRFVVNIVSTLLTADQEPSIPALIGLLGQCLSLLVVYLITKLTTSSLLYIGIALSLSQIFPLVLAFIYLFSTKYKTIFPSLSYFSKPHIRSIFSLGIRFFVIQITALVIFQSNNIIIAHVCGLEDVTKFNIAYKYIYILTMAFSTFVNPLWSAITEAYIKEDTLWINNIIKRLNQLLLLLAFAGIILIMISPFVYKIWLNNTFTPNFVLLSLLLLYFIFYSRSLLYRSFMNGAGKISLQFIVTFIQSLLHIPFAILMGKYIGLPGIVMVMILWAFINAIWEPIQFSRIINKTAKGIWNR
jgi:O-antigen/teichoic acid export membrane protein